MAVAPNTDYKTSNLQYRPQGGNGFSSVKLALPNDQSSVDRALTAIARKVLGEQLPDHLNVTAQASLIQIEELTANGNKTGNLVTLELKDGKWTVITEGSLQANGTKAAGKGANYDTDLTLEVRTLLETVRGIYQQNVGQNNNALNDGAAVKARLDSPNPLHAGGPSPLMPQSAANGSNNNNNNNNNGDNNDIQPNSPLELSVLSENDEEVDELKSKIEQLEATNQAQLDEVQQLQQQLQEFEQLKRTDQQNQLQIQQLNKQIQQLQQQLRDIGLQEKRLRSSVETLNLAPSTPIDATLSALNRAHSGFANTKDQNLHLLDE